MPAPNTLKINDIFWSVQGEGSHAGTPAIFIRFCGCSLRCPYCDSREAWQEGELYDVSRIIESILLLKSEFPASMLVLTGGEPLEQKIGDLVLRLRREFSMISIETNGTCFQELPVDWWAVSPKDGSGFRIHPRLLPFISEIKLIANDLLDFPVVQKVRLISEDIPIFLQPCHGDPDALSKAFSRFKDFQHRGVKGLRLGIQMHRFYGIP